MSSASKSAGIPRCCSATLKANSLFPYTSFLSKLSKSLQWILKVDYFYRLFQHVYLYLEQNHFKTLHEYERTNEFRKLQKLMKFLKIENVIENKSNLFQRIKIA